MNVMQQEQLIQGLSDAGCSVETVERIRTLCEAQEKQRK